MRTFLYIFILFLFIQSNILADIHYVSKTGSNTPPYLSWETASDSIQKTIDICNIGDSVIVGNGVYAESLYISKTISLIGNSADSTIIMGSNGTFYYVVEFFENNSVIKNFTVIGPGGTALYIWKSNVIVSNCIIREVYLGIRSYKSSPIIENVFISNIQKAIYDECPGDTCNGIYRNNVIISTGGTETPVKFQGGGYPTFTNNVMIEEGNNWTGVDGEYLRGIKIKNNLIYGYKVEGISIGLLHNDTAYIINNTLINNCGHPSFGIGSISTINGFRTQIKNNIIEKSLYGIYGYDDSVKADFNLFWQVKKLISEHAGLRDSNIVADPMFVNDTTVASGNYDFHLQKYSPAIDKGDPSIIDIDGTRSDLGMYGGPGGDEYTYLDLSPRAPVNFTATVYSDTIKLKWNKNTEADTSFYRVYRDTIKSFTLDSTKLIAAVTDSFFTERVPLKAKHLYYRVTAVDKCNNQSHPSEELFIDLTSAYSEEPQIVTSYNLYQNYPNPFNPATIISYRLKERGYVKLMVYDLKGELVKVLVNKEQEKGYYETRFDGNGLSSGIYLYRIEVIGNGRIPVFSDMKKMMFLK